MRNDAKSPQQVQEIFETAIPVDLDRDRATFIKYTTAGGWLVEILSLRWGWGIRQRVTVINPLNGIPDPERTHSFVSAPLLDAYLRALRRNKPGEPPIDIAELKMIKLGAHSRRGKSPEALAAN